MVANLSIPRQNLIDFCRRHHVQKLSLFGSVLRDDFSSSSDIDVLVTYDPRYPVGFRVLDMEEELSRIFHNRRVDIVNEKFLNPRLRARILAEAQVQYEQG